VAHGPYVTDFSKVVYPPTGSMSQPVMERTSRPLLNKELGLHYTSIMQHFYFEIQHSQRKRLEIAAVGISYRLDALPGFYPTASKYYRY